MKWIPQQFCIAQYVLYYLIFLVSFKPYSNEIIDVKNLGYNLRLDEVSKSELIGIGFGKDIISGILPLENMLSYCLIDSNIDRVIYEDILPDVYIKFSYKEKPLDTLQAKKKIFINLKDYYKLDFQYFNSQKDIWSLQLQDSSLLYNNLSVKNDSGIAKYEESSFDSWKAYNIEIPYLVTILEKRFGIKITSYSKIEGKYSFNLDFKDFDAMNTLLSHKYGIVLKKESKPAKCLKVYCR